VGAPMQTQSLWVRMHDWLLDEAQLPEPTPGSTLQDTGIRMRGQVTRAHPRAAEEIVRGNNGEDEAPRPVEDRVTGSVIAASDFDLDAGSLSRHGGSDVVLNVNGFLIQIQVDGRARDVTHGSRLSVRGELLVIPYYEWEDFGLVDTRSAWTVTETSRLTGGDILLRLLPALPSS
jgi:hypothetical protein